MNAAVFCLIFAWTFTLVVAALAFTAGIRTRRARDKRHGEAIQPSRRTPADTSRPLLNDVADLDDPDDERLSVCPVCGMADPGNLDALHLGWPAHGECVEWLGDWKPQVHATPGQIREFQGAFDAYAANVGVYFGGTAITFIPRQSMGGTNTIFYAGAANTVTAHAGGGGGGGGYARDTATRWCVCGMVFTGTGNAIHAALAAHHRDGTCPYSPAGRQSPSA